MKLLFKSLIPLLIPSALFAAPMDFDDKSLFLGAAGGFNLATETLEGATTGNLSAGTTDLGLFDVGIQVANPFSTVGAARFSTLPTTVLSVMMNDGFGNSVVFDNFDSATKVVGFGFDVALLNVGTLSVTVQSAGTTFNFDPNDQPFIGVLDLDGVESVTLTSTNEYLELDNFIIVSEPAPIPLPGGAALMLGGLGLLALRKTKR